jgi:cyclophilin family peptidyl-prolyl cis-trans isomerase
MKSIVVGVLALAGLVIAAFAMQPATGADAQKADAQPVETEQAKAPAEEQFVYIQMTTSKGEIFIELNETLAPISTKNFVDYTEAGHYDGTIFHRVISNFMIQGGSFKPDMSQKPSKDPIENEWTNGLSNMRGTLAMARLGGRADSATAQFFINVADNAFLDQPRDGAGYAVFGKVVKGMDVVDAIKAVKTANKGGHGDVPVEPVMIEKVVKLDEAKAKELGLVEAEG